MNEPRKQVNEIRQAEKDKWNVILYVETKKGELTKTESRMHLSSWELLYHIKVDPILQITRRIHFKCSYHTNDKYIR
jgi:hypothetical protein